MISLVPSLISGTALLFLLTATGAATAARPTADIILHNGNIITLNDAQPQASALAISGSRIVAIGDDTATNEWRGDHTRTIELVVAGGTDSTRIGIAGVWHAIEYHITGIASGGSVRKPASERLTRLEALALYTRHAAWLAFAEQHRGQLSVGKQADLAVLNQPFMTMPEDRIDTIRAVLTLVDGRIVHESPDLNAGQ